MNRELTADEWNALPEAKNQKAEKQAAIESAEKVTITKVDDDQYQRLVDILLIEADRYHPDDLSVDADDTLKAIIADRNLAYEQLNILLRDEEPALKAQKSQVIAEFVRRLMLIYKKDELGFTINAIHPEDIEAVAKEMTAPEVCDYCPNCGKGNRGYCCDK